jgi:hypothetical protein
MREAQDHFRKAASFFREAKGRPKATGWIRSEADASIKVCEKNIKEYDEAIRSAPAAQPASK